MRISHTKKHFIFDYNGTLQDDLEVSYLGSVFILEHFGITAPNLDYYQTNIAGDAYENYYYNLGVPRALAKEALIQLWRTGMDSANKPRPLFDDVISTLDELHRLGHDLHVVSGSDVAELNYFIDLHGIRNYFSNIIGHAHNKIIEFENLKAGLNCSGSDMICIGDMAHDARAANHIGATPVLIPRGYNSNVAFDLVKKEIPNLLVMEKLADVVELVREKQEII